jgi:hypothetical protein
MSTIVSLLDNCSVHHKRNLANNTGGGGGPKWTGVRGTLFYKGVKFERGENWSHKVQVFHFLIFVYFSFAIIQFTNQINYSSVEKILGGGHLPPFPPPPPPLRHALHQSLCGTTAASNSTLTNGKMYIMYIKFCRNKSGVHNFSPPPPGGTILLNGPLYGPH